MITKTLAGLGCMALLCSLAACGGSPDSTPSPAVSEPAAGPSTTSRTSATTPSEDPAAPDSADSQASPSSEPATTAGAMSSDEIPSVIHGKWITFSEGEEPRECTDELDNEGAIITIDATRISSFAFFFELEEIEESTADSVEGQFTYQDDSDEPMSPIIRLETEDGWQTLEFIELGTEGQAPALYSRCR